MGQRFNGAAGMGIQASLGTAVTADILFAPEALHIQGDPAMHDREAAVGRQALPPEPVGFDPKASVNLEGQIEIIGQMIYAALGGLSESGADPYDHEITQGTPKLLTVVKDQGIDYGSGKTGRLVYDACFSEFTLSAEPRGALMFSGSLIGCQQGTVATLSQTVPSAVPLMYHDLGGGGNGYVKLKWGSGALTEDANVKKIEVTVSNSSNQGKITAGSAGNPKEILHGKLAVSASITTTFASADAYNQMIDLGYWGLEINFHNSISKALKIEIPNMRFDSDPTPDIGGGDEELDLEISGTAYKSGATQTITITATDSTASYV